MTAENAPKPRRIWWAFHAVMILAIAVVIFLNWRLAQERKRRAELPVLGAVPEFTLTTQSAQPLALADLRGKVWVADFIFTHCAGPCPLMTRSMATLQEKLSGLGDLRLVSFSVDPDRDTPPVLTDYARKFGADPKRWFFLTGDKKRIQDLARNGFKITAIENRGEQRQPDEDEILHSTHFILVDRDANIRGYFDSGEANAIERLAQSALLLAREGQR